MGYTVQRLSTPPVIIVKMFAPSDEGDALRLFAHLDENIQKYDGENSLYLLVDISSITFSQDFAIAHLVDTIFKIYATWHTEKDLKAWIVADNSLIPAVHFLVRGADIPLTILDNYSIAIERIEMLFADTKEFKGAENRS